MIILILLEFFLSSALVNYHLLIPLSPFFHSAVHPSPVFPLNLPSAYQLNHLSEVKEATTFSTTVRPESVLTWMARQVAQQVAQQVAPTW